VLVSYSTSKLITATSDDGSQRALLHHGDSISRFLADRDQRPPIELCSVQTQDEAEADGEARMSEILDAFNVRFGGGDRCPTAECKKEEE
jgi:hypothetical protein